MAIGVATTLSASAQQQDMKSFTLEDLNFGGTNYRNMIPKNLHLGWWGDVLMYQDSGEFGTVDVKTGKKTAITTTEQVNEVLVKDNPANKMSWLYYAEFPYADKPLVLLKNSRVRMLYDWKAKNIVWKQACKDEAVSDWHPMSRAVAFVKADQLYVTDAKGNTRQLTTDGSREIVYGQAVHRNEFGIDGGLFWSNDGKKLAFYRMDQSMVTDYPQVNTFTRCAELEPDKYPMAGMTSHKVTVGVYDLETDKTVYLKAGDPTDRYFTNIAWGPDNKTVYMFELNRDQNDCLLVSYDAVTGDKIDVLYRETSDKYVEPMHPIVFLPWDKSKFMMQSQRDGFNHLYVCDINAKLYPEMVTASEGFKYSKSQNMKQVTKGRFVIQRVLGFNSKQKTVIVEANAANDIQRNIYAVNINNGNMKLLDNGRGYHNGSLSGTGAFLYDNYSEPDVPRNIEIVNTATAKRDLIFTAEDPWKGYKVPEYTTGTLKAADGKTDLYYRMVKPVDFDPSKKYPTVVYVYGGPHAHNVDARWHWSSRSWETYMAQKGYLLFILDNRGSENRGREFEQATFRHLGQEEMKDQIKGVEYLKTLPYVDADRLGVHGWSFGGFMTISLMTNYPDVFKVGVAGGPVIDWKWYEVMYGERYMDTPDTNKEGYEQTSLLDKAKNLKGKLQIIIGMNDPTVVPQHALQFIDACTEVGTQPDFFVYPGEGHNMRGHKSVHLHERITQYFEDYLK